METFAGVKTIKRNYVRVSPISLKKSADRGDAKLSGPRMSRSLGTKAYFGLRLFGFRRDLKDTRS